MRSRSRAVPALLLAFGLAALLRAQEVARAPEPATAASITEPGRGLGRVFDVLLPPAEEAVT